jgi:hypothetical protein
MDAKVDGEGMKMRFINTLFAASANSLSSLGHDGSRGHGIQIGPLRTLVLTTAVDHERLRLFNRKLRLTMVKQNHRENDLP